VANSGTSAAATFNFGIPAGATGNAGATGATGATGSAGATGAQGPIGVTGPTGTAATIAAGSASGLSAGSSPTVTNAGTSAAAIFNFGIPAGATGATGATGPAGLTGPAGANGTNGANGATGATGAAGTNGTNGTNGATGATGPAGPAPSGTPNQILATAASPTGGTTVSGLRALVAADVPSTFPQKYPFDNLGDGVTTVFTLTHNIGSKHYSVGLFYEATGVEFEGDVTRGLNAATITFLTGSPPAASSFGCTVIG
jgi:hypothetical protein